MLIAQHRAIAQAPGRQSRGSLEMVVAGSRVHQAPATERLVLVGKECRRIARAKVSVLVAVKGADGQFRLGLRPVDLLVQFLPRGHRLDPYQRPIPAPAARHRQREVHVRRVYTSFSSRRFTACQIAAVRPASVAWKPLWKYRPRRGCRTA